MNVSDLMCREVRVVRPVDRLDTAARTMWEHDCGCVPVVDAAGVLVGVITDRDLCMAAYTQGRSLGEIQVGNAMARTVRTCRADDSVTTALATLQQTQVHRLPVVDARGAVVGMLSLNDLVRAAVARPAAVDAAGVMKALAAVVAPRKPAAAQKPPVAAAPAPAAPAAVATAVAPVVVPAKPAVVAAAAPTPPATVAPAPVAPAKAPVGKGKPMKKGKKG
jgi:CBS domain-containing protein